MVLWNTDGTSPWVSLTCPVTATLSDFPVISSDYFRKVFSNEWPLNCSDLQEQRCVYSPHWTLVGHLQQAFSCVPSILPPGMQMGDAAPISFS